MKWTVKFSNKIINLTVYVFGPDWCIWPVHYAQAAATGTLSAGGCNRHPKRGREELPHVRGQGQKPGGPHTRRAAAKRSYPMSEVRGSGQECQAATAQEQLRGVTPRPRSGAVVKWANPGPRSGGWVGIGGQRGAIPRWRSGWAAVRRYPSSKVRSSGCPLLEQPWRDTPRPR